MLIGLEYRAHHMIEVLSQRYFENLIRVFWKKCPIDSFFIFCKYVPLTILNGINEKD